MAFEDLFRTAAPSTPTGVSTTEAGIPTAFRPQVEGLLGSATQQVFNVSPTGQITGARGYTPYSTDPRDYVAGFSPLQEQAFRGVAGLTLPGQFGTAGNFISQAVQRALGTAYQPGTFANQYRAPSPYRFDEYEPEDVTAPRLQAYQMAPAERVAAQQVGTPLMSAAQTAYRPDLRTFQMGPAERVGTTSFTAPRTAESFMSPYMQNVVNRQQQAAQREADIQRQALGAQFAQAGAFGGGRFGVQQARAAEALARQKGDIQAQGLQSAFGQAQQQFNTEQQARLQAALANQQAGLTTGQQNLAAQLGVQQLGTQTGLQTALANLNTSQQANVQNQAAQLQAQGLNSEQALRAALANQQAGLTTGQQNLAAQLGVQQLGAGQNLQAQLANQQIGLNAAQLAAQQGQFGYGQNMAAAQLGAQYGLEAQRAQEASRQFGANLGLQGLQAALSGAGTLGNLGQQQLAAQQGILGLQGQFGQQQQQNQQNIINAALQNYQMQQQYPMQQLAAYSQLLQPFARPSQTQTIYQAPPTMAQQLLGLGLGGAGIYNLLNSGQTGSGGGGGGFFDALKNIFSGAEGGEVKEEPQRMAEGGIASAINRRVLEDPMSAGPQTYANSQQRGILSPTIAAYANDIQNRMRQAIQASQMMQRSPNPTVLEQQAMAAAQQGQGIDGLPSGLPAQGYAPGGIVAFDEGGEVPRFFDGALIGPEFGGYATPEVAPSRLRSEDEVAQIVNMLKAAGKPVGLSTIKDIREGRGAFAFDQPTAAPSTAPTLPSRLPQQKVPASDAGITTLRRPSAPVPQAPAASQVAPQPVKTDAERLEELTGQIKDPFEAQRRELNLERERAAREIFGEQQAQLKGVEERQAAKEGRLRKLEEDILGNKRNNEAYSLIRAGMGILNAKPGSTFAQALGFGAVAGIDSYEAGMERIRKAQERLEDARDKLDESKAGTEKERIAARANLNKTLLQSKEEVLKGTEQAFGIKRQDARLLLSTELEREKMALDKEMGEKRIAASLEAARIGARNNQLETMTVLGGGNPLLGAQRLAEAQTTGRRTEEQMFADFIKARPLLQTAPIEKQIEEFNKFQKQFSVPAPVSIPGGANIRP